MRLVSQIQQKQIGARRLEGAGIFAGLLVSEADLKQVMPDVTAQYCEANGYPALNSSTQFPLRNRIGETQPTKPP